MTVKEVLVRGRARPGWVRGVGRVWALQSSDEAMLLLLSGFPRHQILVHSRGFVKPKGH